MKRWIILNKFKDADSNLKNEKIIKILLKNRGLTERKEIQEFLYPKLSNITIESVGIDKKQLKKAMNRVNQAIEINEQIIIYGDYDVDGITGTAILWETLHNLNTKVLPFIPNRIDEGYGLSIKGIENILSQNPGVKLIITVDNGIVANEAVKFAREQGIDVIITDHHTKGTKLPDAFAIVHTTGMCGAGIAWLIVQQFKKMSGVYDLEHDEHLELATLGTIADLVPLTGANRAVVKFGLDKLNRTRRPGLIELLKIAGCEKQNLGVYEVGFIIAPRLNAAGRIESAMDSLRLICTKDKSKAKLLAEKLELTNRERQLLMRQATEHASLAVKMEDSLKKILIVAHESYQQGVIGLVAGKLVDEYYRPSIVISMGEKYSKASARSVDGFNIIEFLRSTPEYFVNVGGHPMAAGFTIETEKIIFFKESLEISAGKILNGEILTKSLKIDCVMSLSKINNEFYKILQQLAPFGMANPQPVFVSYNVNVENLKVLGREGKHLRLSLNQADTTFEAIAFGMGEMAREINIDDKIDIAYSIDENTWNGNTKLQLKIKDFRLIN